MSGRLDGRTAIVTGGGRGIGAAVARELTGRGARVTVFARSAAELDEVVGSGGAALAVAGDVTVEADLVRLRASHERVLGPCDVLVHAAGILERGRVEVLDPAAWRRVLEVNLTGAFLVTRAVLPGMRSRGRGRILAIASISGHVGTPEGSAYNASKWGLIGFAKSLAEELRGPACRSSRSRPAGSPRACWRRPRSRRPWGRRRSRGWWAGARRRRRTR